MKIANMLGLAMVFVLVGCAASEPSEEKGATSSKLSADCMRSIKSQPGSAEWRAELDKCLNEARTPRGPEAPRVPEDPRGPEVPGAPEAPRPEAPRPPPAPPVPRDDDGQSCSQSVQCVNGSCTCGSGPNAGQRCDGASRDGADSCNVLCRDCR